MLAADEREPGTWYLVDTSGRDYGRIRSIQIGDERGYEALVKPVDGPVRRVGYFTSLRASCERVHRAFVGSHGSRGPIGWERPDQYAARSRAVESPQNGRQAAPPRTGAPPLR